ncbi:MAG: hypothetical protein A2836_00590 [Candidatus Taylorbacteria bacterium RIFCSPHIGHO2_01_FULL_45_63]|uniref:Uncharacterized protein n=1 Tax=Candidatus Taylorbacteria bacterium RIFCSPHIGHO2_02_FULL_45_35 TaxID=1802311 RepID=A0A1G2MPK7_9BACT|nr:MAG: hypothetical protein A2836_00590 [Candidatus Taylorbacteria bacterium RIFCSPHIGHO2_01_FULL_45_63]OHA25674.1 MAG: hypothetical protein A3D56_04085 [Candidatus Taylorbacteria bacterium RIFCSPHIGHO2_02_FULL_45_35]OHA35082.1 MAG: hypothetical protein A3A22_02375 [Candidatus Taylorbacteria bacterium RIFCSPLOWO2_01_FULL_45_34b]
MRKTVMVGCRGITPLLVHHIIDQSRRDEIASCSDENLEEFFARDAEGKIVIPIPWIRDCVRSHVAVQKMPIGYGYQAKKSDVKKNVFILGKPIHVTSPEGTTPEWTVYSHPRHMAKGSKRIGLVRCPQINSWHFTFGVDYEEPPINIAMLQQLIAAAGCYVGLGLFRPEGGSSYANQFGKFEPVQFSLPMEV